MTIDTATGSASLVGSIGFVSVSGLAIDSANDVLFGVDTNTSNLISINRATGAGSVIGDLGFPIDDITSLAFDATAGLLYGIDRDFTSDDDLVTIDRTTGEAVVVGGGPLGFFNVGSLAFAPSVPEPACCGMFLTGGAAAVCGMRHRSRGRA